MVSFISVIIYCMLAELSSSILRAALFLTLAVIGKLINKDLKLLPCTAFITLLFFFQNPNNLTDIGFQLSVFSFLGLVLFFEDFENKTPENLFPAIKFVLLIVLETMSAQIMVLPIQLFYFNTFQPTCFISNIFAVPLASVIFIACSISTIFFYLSKLIPLIFINHLFSTVIDLLCKLFIYWINILSLLNTGEIFTPKFSLFKVIFLYTAILFICFLTIQNKEFFKTKTILFMLCILLLCLDQASVTNGCMKVYFIPKYNQDLILILEPNEMPLLIGTINNKKVSYDIREFLKLNGYKKSYLFYNLKENLQLSSSSDSIKDEKNKIKINYKDFNLVIYKNLKNKVNDNAEIIKLPLLMKKDPSLKYTINTKNYQLILNDIKKLSKKSAQDLKWLKKQYKNALLLSESGTITLTIKNKDIFSLEKEN